MDEDIVDRRLRVGAVGEGHAGGSGGLVGYGDCLHWSAS